MYVDNVAMKRLLTFFVSGKNFSIVLIGHNKIYTMVSVIASMDNKSEKNWNKYMVAHISISQQTNVTDTLKVLSMFLNIIRLYPFIRKY